MLDNVEHPMGAEYVNNLSEEELLEEYNNKKEDLLNELKKIIEEIDKNDKDMVPYSDDIEEDNFCGDSIEMVAYFSELNDKCEYIINTMERMKMVSDKYDV